MGAEAFVDDKYIRQTALKYKIFTVTTISAAHATVEAIERKQHQDFDVKSLQEYYTEA